jgi:hypothetical protein
MLDRVAQLIGGAADGMWLGTFHSVGVRVLRRHAELVGLKSNFTILDTDDQTRLIKQLLQAEGIDDKKWPARVLSGIIQRWKDRALSPDKDRQRGRRRVRQRQGGRDLSQYQARLAEVNAVDFGDLVMHCVTLWQQHPDVLAQYHRRFRHILVDEYQDTNVAQYLWLRLLAQGTQDVCCVGDDDQSIYGWRGAEVGNILRFEKDFPGRHHRAAGAQLPLDAAHPGRRLAPDRPQRRAAGQDAVDRIEGRRAHLAARRVGRRRGGAHRSARRSRRCSATSIRSARSPSWCAPASRPASSRSASSPWACPTG